MPIIWESIIIFLIKLTSSKTVDIAKMKSSGK